MRHIMFACLVVLCAVTSAPSGVPEPRDEAASHHQWITKILRQIETIKVGMTRQDLLKVFTTEGGISTRERQTFVHKECGYIKVDVEFKPRDQENQDHITAISRPYLQWSIDD